MTELQEPIVTERPSCFPENWEAPEIDPQRLWVTWGWTKNLDVKPESERWIKVFRSKEEAEAWASIPCEFWAWNGDATCEPLSAHMRDARRWGRKGVRCLGFDPETREWIVLKEWRSDEPIGEER